MLRVTEKIAVSLDEAAELTGLGSSIVRKAIDSGELASCQIGKRRRIRVADLDAWIRSHKVILAPRKA